MNRVATSEDLDRFLTGELSEDYSASFATIRAAITDSGGVRLVEFVRQLTPDYSRVYRDLTVGFIGLAASVALACAASSMSLPTTLIVAGGALLTGFWFFYLVSFIHEGLHGNLCPSRKVNDAICGTLIACMLGLQLQSRRKQHFEHHRSLGTVHDTEMMYFFPLNLDALIKSGTGVGAVRALVAYVRRATGATRGRAEVAAAVDSLAFAATPWNTGVYLAVAAGILTHGAVVSGLWFLGWGAAAVAWILAVLSVMPILNTIRQLLEHRHPDARMEVDYTHQDQGACTRMFTDGWLDRMFGPAGGHQHLLHHWEGQVSYTRLPDLERFLADTPLRGIIDRRRTTYAQALRAIFLP